jgi:ribosome-associated protein
MSRLQAGSVGYDSKALRGYVFFLSFQSPGMKPRATLPQGASGDPEPPSKSARKRAMHDLQALGEALVALDPGRLATLALPERLADAIAQARTITKHEGRRRQLQYVGRLMRDVDATQIQAALDGWGRGTAIERARFAALESWRERLLDDSDGLAEFAAAYPAVDMPALARLVAEARSERLRGGAPHKYRALFRALKHIVDAA